MAFVCGGAAVFLSRWCDHSSSHPLVPSRGQLRPVPAQSVPRARPVGVPAVPTCGVYTVLPAAPRCPLSPTPG